jgi:SAM-dependent methyltransferase
MNPKYPSPVHSSSAQSCWCGNATLDHFCDGYGHCPQCETLVSLQPPSAEQLTADTKDGIYGKDYFEHHYVEKSNMESTAERLRQDLRGRDLYRLRVLLKYKLPGASILEVGCGHGGFVATMLQAGFNATGLELSPWLAELAHETFGISIRQGKVEDISIDKSSQDAVILMDVIEHLPDAESTIRHCASLLKPDGIMIIQTPRYPEGITHAQLLTETPSFKTHLLPSDHIFLYSNQSLRLLIERCGLPQIEFEQAIFSHYDMFAVCSRQPATLNSDKEISEALCRTANGRFMQVMLDIDGENRLCSERTAKLEADVAYLIERVQKAEAAIPPPSLLSKINLSAVFNRKKYKPAP